MADTTTPNYGLTKPEVGASEDTWGTKINTNLNLIDTQMKVSDTRSAANTTVANAALSRAGGTMTGDTAHGDNVKSKYGTGNDLQIYHDGANSYIKEGGTGHLYIGADNLKLVNAAVTEDYIQCVTNGAVTLYNDSNAKLATTSTGVDVTGSVNDSSGNVRAGRKNLIINGDMQVSQRGTSSTANGFVSLDRWYVNQSGGSTTFSQETNTSPSETGGIKSYARLNVSSSSDYTGILQRIEDVTSVPSGTVTLSFWAKGTAPVGGLYVYTTQDFGTGGSADVDVGYVQITASLTSSWVKYSTQITIPSVDGKTINSGSYLILSIVQGSNTSSTAYDLNITGVQLELGSGTDFEHRSYGEELALCQRFCYVFDGTENQDLMLFGVGSGTGTANCTHLHPVEMRSTPTLTTTAMSTFSSYSFGAQSSGGTPTSFGVSTAMSNKNWFYVDVVCSGNITGTGVMIRANGTATKLTFDAEL